MATSTTTKTVAPTAVTVTTFCVVVVLAAFVSATSTAKTTKTSAKTDDDFVGLVNDNQVADDVNVEDWRLLTLRKPRVCIMNQNHNQNVNV